MPENPTSAPDGQQAITSWADNVVPVIPVDYLEHTLDNPFCWREICPCHWDEEALDELIQFYEEGLISFDDGVWILTGKTV